MTDQLTHYSVTYVLDLPFEEDIIDKLLEVSPSIMDDYSGVLSPANNALHTQLVLSVNEPDFVNTSEIAKKYEGLIPANIAIIASAVMLWSKAPGGAEVCVGTLCDVCLCEDCVEPLELSTI